MKNLSIRGRLSLAFGVLLVVVLLISGGALKALGNASSQFDDYVNGVNARAASAHLVREAIDQRAIAARNLVLVDNPQDMAEEHRIVLKAHADVDTHLSRLVKLGQAPGVPEEARRMIDEMQKIEKAYAPVALGIVELAVNKKKDEAIVKMNKECRPLLAALVKVSQEYSDLTAARSQKLIEQAETDYKDQRALLIAGVLVAVLCATAAGVLITRSITSALGAEPGELSDLMRKVAAGDLTSLVRTRDGDVSSVMVAVKSMQGSLVDVVTSVRQNAENVASASAQIAQGNNDLSSRTEQQASALEETAASMEELSSTVRQNADNARQGNQLAQSASAVAAKGGEVVGEVVETMKGINDASKRISDIIGVIDGIAFQTNILALNAAVEAARAGEQGRGFAVVASEVRSLAQRSADAAKEIKGLISTSVERVERGTALVDQAGVTMTEVVQSIRRVTDIMGEISSASTEQSAGVAQVGEAVTQMDQATQQNAALVEESAAAAESLEGQARQLVQAVAVFKLGHGAGVSTASLVAEPVRQARPAVERRGTAVQRLIAKPRAVAGSAKPQPAVAHAKGESDEWTSF